MNEKTVEENLPELSTQERMFLSLRNFKKFVGGVWVVAAALCFLIVVIVVYTGSYFETVEPGLHVAFVMDDYGAQKAGIQTHDVIVKMNGIPTLDDAGAKHAWSSFEPGETVSITFSRGAEQFTVPVETTSCPVTIIGLPDCAYPESGFVGIQYDFKSALLGNIATYAILSLIAVSILILWLVLRGFKWLTEIDSIRIDYTNQTYFFALGTSTHGEAENMSMDFLEIATQVFPELKKYDLEQRKKTGEEMEVEESILEGKKGKSEDYIFDVRANTNDGDFLIKHFKKDKIKFEELEEAGKLAKENYEPLRLVCLAKSFDNNTIKKIDEYEKKLENKVPIDLVLIQEKGFSALKISTVIRD